MLMPKAPVDEYYGISSWQYDVGLAWQVPAPQGEAESEAVQERPDALLGQRVPVANPTHIPTPSFLGDPIHIDLPPLQESRFLLSRQFRQPFRLTLRGRSDG
jgi:hypothetical protein